MATCGQTGMTKARLRSITWGRGGLGRASKTQRILTCYGWFLAVVRSQVWRRSRWSRGPTGARAGPLPACSGGLPRPCGAGVPRDRRRSLPARRQQSPHRHNVLGCCSSARCRAGMTSSRTRNGIIVAKSMGCLEAAAFRYGQKPFIFVQTSFLSPRRRSALWRADRVSAAKKWRAPTFRPAPAVRDDERSSWLRPTRRGSPAAARPGPRCRAAWSGPASARPVPA